MLVNLSSHEFGIVQQCLDDIMQDDNEDNNDYDIMKDDSSNKRKRKLSPSWSENLRKKKKRKLNEPQKKAQRIGVERVREGRN